jgi:hypothetical protein
MERERNVMNNATNEDIAHLKIFFNLFCSSQLSFQLYPAGSSHTAMEHRVNFSLGTGSGAPTRLQLCCKAAKVSIKSVLNVSVR